MTLLKFDHLTATPILREIQYWRIQTVQKCNFLAILEVLNFDFSKFEQLSSPKFTKNSKFRVSKIAKNDIFEPFEYAKIWFHVKSELQLNDQISTKSSLNFTFWKFLEHSDIGQRNIRKAKFLKTADVFRFFSNNLATFSIISLWYRKKSD